MFIYNTHLTAFNKKYYRKENLKRDLKRYVRIPGRRSSEGTIGFKKVFEPLYEKIAIKIDRKKDLKEEYNHLSLIPALRRRLHVSCEWERYNLNQPDEINYH